MSLYETSASAPQTTHDPDGRSILSWALDHSGPLKPYSWRSANACEQAYLSTLSSWQLLKIGAAKQAAEEAEAALDALGLGYNADQLNAFLHCSLMCIMATQVGPDVAWQTGVKHENL